MKTKLKCAVKDCQRPARGPSGFCSACQSWWRYHRYQSATEYSGYLHRIQLAESRVGSFRIGR